MKNENGFTLIEVAIALAVLGLIGVGFLSGLTQSSNAIVTSDERTAAESVARTEMEYIKNQSYLPVSSWPAFWNGGLPTPNISWAAPPALPAGFTVTITSGLLHATDDGIQKITITVKHLNKAITTFKDPVTGVSSTLVGYRAK